jgi:hypothetical protein
MHDPEIPMPRVTVDAATAQMLGGSGEPLEIRDEAGNVLGHFTPDERSPAFREWLRNLDHGLTQEEVERRIAERKGFSTEEVLARLRGARP